MPRKHARTDVEASSVSIRPLDGFQSLSAFIASDFDHTALVFERFDKLAARNLLYLQSELIGLQAEQESLDAEDRSVEHGDRATKECAMNWESFSNAAAEKGSRQEKRMELVQRIRKVMTEYRKEIQMINDECF
jgi:hypothetical protein